VGFVRSRGDTAPGLFRSLHSAPDLCSSSAIVSIRLPITVLRQADTHAPAMHS